MKTATLNQTATAAMNKSTKDKANALMREYVQSLENKRNLQATIANELAAYDKNMKEAEAALIELGERYKPNFDADGNLHLEDGYLHIANNTIVETTKKFNLLEFSVAFSDLIDIKLKTAPVKKLWLNKEGNKDLKQYGVRVDTVEVMQVLPNKKL